MGTSYAASYRLIRAHMRRRPRAWRAFYSPREIADTVPCSLSRVRRDLASGRLFSIRVKRAHRVPLGALLHAYFFDDLPPPRVRIRGTGAAQRARVERDRLAARHPDWSVHMVGRGQEWHLWGRRRPAR